VFGQGARVTRFVWRGPGDRPAFDFNRCQDCGLGHFSLEVDGGVFTVRTDREFIVVPPTLNVGNDAGKGLGTGSGASTVRTAGYQVGLFAVFVGKAAEKLIAMGSEAHKRMGC
jgi:hypothetical protein